MNHAKIQRRWLVIMLIAAIGISGIALLLRFTYVSAASRLALVQD